MGSLGIAAFALLALGPSTPREQFDALVGEYETASRDVVNALQQAKTDADRDRASKLDPDEEKFADRFLDLAEKHPDDLAAMDALTWPFLNYVYMGPRAERAVTLIIRDHLRDPRIAPVYQCLALLSGRNAERLFPAAIPVNRDREVLAWCHFGLDPPAQGLLEQASRW